MHHLSIYKLTFIAKLSIISNGTRASRCTVGIYFTGSAIQAVWVTYIYKTYNTSKIEPSLFYYRTKQNWTSYSYYARIFRRCRKDGISMLRFLLVSRKIHYFGNQMYHKRLEKIKRLWIFFQNDIMKVLFVYLMQNLQCSQLSPKYPNKHVQIGVGPLNLQDPPFTQ